MNWLADKLLSGLAETTQWNLGYIRQARRFDPNKYEAAVNGLSGRAGASNSQKIATANNFGATTSGLLIGGRVDRRDERGGGGQRTTTSSRTPVVPYVNPVAGTQILPGTGPKPTQPTSGGGGGRRTTTPKTPKQGSGGLQGPP